MSQPLMLPSGLAADLAARSWQHIAIGESRAEVYRLIQSGQPDLILKALIRDPLHSLCGETARLRWLKDRAPVPDVVDFIQDSSRDFLLMSALPGADAANSALPPDSIVNLLADALRELHAVPIDDCPFRHLIDDCVMESKARFDAGQVDNTNFDSASLDRNPADLYAEMLATRPASEATAFTHGDFCLPNVIITEGRLSGFIDVGRAGIGDPYRDLALIGRSLNRNLGNSWADRFLSRYGLKDPDPARLRYFRLIDEFF
jgi:aminoglycoside 3'-phosphotransferase-2